MMNEDMQNTCLLPTTTVVPKILMTGRHNCTTNTSASYHSSHIFNLAQEVWINQFLSWWSFQQRRTVVVSPALNFSLVFFHAKFQCALQERIPCLLHYTYHSLICILLAQKRFLHPSSVGVDSPAHLINPGKSKQQMKIMDESHERNNINTIEYNEL